ncbi:hypothetical protein [Nocardiopsis rhodophaea]
MFILGVLASAGALFLGFGTFVRGYGATKGSGDATLANFIEIAAALTLAIAVTSFVLGFLATKHSQLIKSTR